MVGTGGRLKGWEDSTNSVAKVATMGDDQLNVFGEDTTGGGPGSGKGTQCKKLVEKYGFTYLSTGELLHNELASESERSKLIRDIMERGDLVPSGIVLELLKEAMVASLGDTKGFLIDGYPREVKQGQEFGRRIGDPHLVICMDCSADTMTSRLLQRSQSHKHADVATKTIAKRLETYYRASIPVVAYYETKTQLRKSSNPTGDPCVLKDVNEKGSFCMTVKGARAEGTVTSDLKSQLQNPPDNS
ncbi:Adenylate kinase isoenzyme 5 [Tupaia chinensis]|uniref:Adenylate kinase isoenzyme 5 n=1 Tax=Tupaia chinensis TaxID=246437 RepID=L9KYN8_TUPCH|nr:Adenylate kinase isoenzyme 5 [Tupaia chinensis]